jgi:hypothetical protein
MSCGNTGRSAFATPTMKDADSNEQYRFEPWHTASQESLRQSHAHRRSSDFGETVIAHVLMVMRRLVDVLVVR